MSPFGEWRLFRLHPEGLQYDLSGLELGGVALPRREGRANGATRWSPRPPEALEPALSRLFGAPIALAAKQASLDLVARCLTNGDMALAQIAAVHLEMPDPPPLANAALPHRSACCGNWRRAVCSRATGTPTPIRARERRQTPVGSRRRMMEALRSPRTTSNLGRP